MRFPTLTILGLLALMQVAFAQDAADAPIKENMESADDLMKGWPPVTNYQQAYEYKQERSRRLTAAAAASGNKRQAIFEREARKSKERRDKQKH